MIGRYTISVLYQPKFHDFPTLSFIFIEDAL